MKSIAKNNKYLNKMRNVYLYLIIVFKNIIFIYKNRRYKKTKKIIYLLTPPPRLSNIGDHAQAIAIHKWFKKHFSYLEVLELNKDDSDMYILALKYLVNKDDIIFLHSGGNLGDRGIWTESIRRKYIKKFKKNKIISLPQTIYFSSSRKGRIEKKKTEKIYNKHNNLIIMGRDEESTNIAKHMFINSKIYNIPDFVLSLDVDYGSNNKVKAPKKILLCLRKDKESILSESERKRIIQNIPYYCRHYDTTLKKPIVNRENTLIKTLKMFSQFDIIITDRYHGLIFSVLCKKPCIVIPTVDHKLTSAIHWFKEISFVLMLKDINEIPNKINELIDNNSKITPNWNHLYFDSLAKQLKRDLNLKEGI